MGHHARVFLFRGEIDRRPAARLEHTCLCELPQGIVALPVTDAWLEAQSETEVDAATFDQQGFLYLDDDRWRIARAIARGGRFAYLETDYFAGLGDQRAMVWDGDRPLRGPVSINEALGQLGVVADGAVDRFEAIGLDVMRSDDRFLAGYDASVFAIHGSPLVGRYAGAPGWLELREEAHHLVDAGGRWRLLPNRHFADAQGREHEVQHETGGTPGLLRLGDGVLWHYNDGPSLVEAFGRPEWAALAGRYENAGKTLEVTLAKKHLYLGPHRLLEEDARTFHTGSGARYVFTDDRLDDGTHTWVRTRG
jgi:hypothetical protein